MVEQDRQPKSYLLEEEFYGQTHLVKNEERKMHSGF